MSRGQLGGRRLLTETDSYFGYGQSAESFTSLESGRRPPGCDQWTREMLFEYCGATLNGESGTGRIPPLAHITQLLVSVGRGCPWGDRLTLSHSL